MDLDAVAWVVHRYLVDPRLDDAEPRVPATGLVASTACPDDLRYLEKLSVRTFSDEVSSAG